MGVLGGCINRNYYVPSYRKCVCFYSNRIDEIGVFHIHYMQSSKCVSVNLFHL